MAWTMKHERTSFEDKITQLGCSLLAYRHHLHVWRKQTGRDDFPTTKQELKEFGIAQDDMITLQEMEQEEQAISTTELDIFTAQLKRGMRGLAARIRVDTALPYVPKQVRDQSYYLYQVEGGDPYDYDEHYAMEIYPGILDEITAHFLYRYSDNDHIFPHAMYAVGAYWVSEGWSDAQLVHWFVADGTIQTFDLCPLLTEKCREFKAMRDPSQVNLSRTAYAELLAILASAMLHYDFEQAAHWGELENTVCMIKDLPLHVLQREAEAEGLPHVNDKAKLLVLLVEHIYQDVLEPRATL